jgi:hypothetical protein
MKGALPGQPSQIHVHCGLSKTVYFRVPWNNELVIVKVFILFIDTLFGTWLTFKSFQALYYRYRRAKEP